MPEVEVDARHLAGLLGSAGKNIAGLPHAKRVIAQLREAKDPRHLCSFLQSVDIGLEEPARQVICDAASDEAQWKEVHSTLVRSAEMQLVERFSPSS